MIDSARLIAQLESKATSRDTVVKRLENDLRKRCDENPAVDAPLKAQYEAAKAKKRTALTYGAWREEELTNIAVAWVLACVFIRFLEDNDLVETPKLSGPGARLQRARDEHEVFFREHPTETEREYLLAVFGATGALPGMREFFDPKHNPLWLAAPSGDACRELWQFWQKTDPDTGALAHDFTDPEWNTRFLGDLYQDLSETARKRYALLQTPVFVEQFILDRTLTPAIETFGFYEVRMIDPTCGSGHFLLGGFERLHALWGAEHSDSPRSHIVQRVLNQIHGVDLNPNVVAIARFRLLLAALRASGVTKLRDAFDFRLHVTVGDALLHGARFDAEGKPYVRQHQERFDGHEVFRDELAHYFETEDSDTLHHILGQQYHAVVGNPPYITVKDRALSELYRARYGSCSGKYSLSVPFMERFFDLALRGHGTAHKPAGFVGQITSNSFMKREFGKKLIETFLPRWDLTHILDTSVAYIPGHGTPTVILFGRNQPPVRDTIRTVLGIRGEPVTPTVPSKGLVWRSICQQIDQPGSASQWVSTANSPRINFHSHPWSVGGGGAAELKDLIEESAGSKLGNNIGDIGVFGMTNADDTMLSAEADFFRKRVGSDSFRRLIAGDLVRDWSIADTECVLFPFNERGLRPLNDLLGLQRWLWPARTTLGNRATFSRATYFTEGRAWWSWHQIAVERLEPPLTITWGEVATHNHFVLDRGGRVFKQTAPVIKLKPQATEADHINLLGVMNSSAACFWLQQVCHNKGGPGGGSSKDEKWHDFYALNATKIAELPIPTHQPLRLPAALVAASTELQSHAPVAVLAALEATFPAANGVPSASELTSSDTKQVNSSAESVSSRAETVHSTPETVISASDLVTSESKRSIPGRNELIVDQNGSNLDRNEPTTDQTELPPDRNEVDLVRKDQFQAEINLFHDGSANLPRTLAAARAAWHVTRQRMISLQEELDWQIYAAFGLVEAADDLGLPEGDADTRDAAPPIVFGERAFEFVLARRMAGGEEQTTWFERHGAIPRTDLPAHWPAAYRARVERRIARIAADANIRLIERPEYKRRWNTEPWDEQLQRAARDWLLARLEGYFHEGQRVCELTDGFSPAAHGFTAAARPHLATANELADVAQTDRSFLEVAESYVGSSGFSVSKLVRELVEGAAVPYLPVQRYKDSGLRKRQDWEHVWTLQRQEDAIDAAEKPDEPGLSDIERARRHADAAARKKTELGDIPVPPKYAGADFLKAAFWKLRGKLDVPKERWVSYPGAERAGDDSLLIAWAGWDHLQQAQALAEYYLDAKDNQGWQSDRLKPLLAGLADLIPWLKQWHDAPDPNLGMGLGDYFAGFLDEQCRSLSTTPRELEFVRLGNVVSLAT